jgi:hypothetical protein
MKRYIHVLLVAVLVWPAILAAQVPHLLNYQGRVAVGSVNFEGTGQFKFALVNANGSTTYWSNDNTSTAGSQPTAAVALTVTKGLYAVLLGDTALPNMTAIPASVWTHPDVRLRVWFNDGTNGSQLLTPDQRLAPNGYLPDGSVTEAKLADGSISGAKLAGGSIGGAQLAPGLTLGGITTGTFSGNLAGNATTASAATSAVSFSGPLAGEVTGTQGATTIAAATITSKLLTGFSSTTGAITATDSILTAINKLDGNLALKAPLASPTFTGTVSGTFSGNGSALTSLNATNLGSGTLADARLSANVALRNAANSFSATQTLAPGTATVAPLKLQEGTNLTTPQFGAVEFDGTNLFLTNDSGSPTRKTLAFNDSTISGGQIANGTITGAMLANGAVGSAQLAAGAVTATAIAMGTVLPSQTVSGTTTAVANTNYSATSNDTPVSFVLPETANVGDVIQINGNGTAGWNAVVSTPWTGRGYNGNWVSVASSADGAKLVAAGSGMIYTSTDYALTWTSRFGGSWRSIASSADGNKLVAVATNIFTSTDSGVTWTPRAFSHSWMAVASSTDGVKLVAAAEGGRIYTSVNSGVSWTPRESDRPWRSVASSADGVKLVATAYGGQVYTSTDSGVNWVPREQNRDWTSVASSSDGTKLVAVANFGQIYTSTDSGASWTARESVRSWTSVASSADGIKLIAGTYGRIYTSTNSGVSWTAQGNSRQWNSVASSADGSRLVAAPFGDQIYTNYTQLSEAEGTSVTLQYGSDGQWMARHENQIAAGAVGAPQIAAGSISGSHIVFQAIASHHLAHNLEVSGNLTGNVTGNVSGSASNFTGALAGDVTGTQGATVVSSVGGATAANVAAGAGLANAATHINTAGAIVKRDGSGNFSAGTITASLNGNAATATTAGSATNFTGALAGDVTGTQGATVVSSIGGSSAANVAAGAGLANAATNANTTGTLVKRDGSGNFTAGTITAMLNGNATTATTASTANTAMTANSATTATTAGSAANFTGALAGDITGTQGATSIAAATVTGKTLTGFSSSTGSVTASDTILSAINKLDGNLALKAPLASPTFTGTVSGTFSGNGSTLTSLNATNLSSGTIPDGRLSANVAMRNAANSFSATQTLAAGTATVAPLKLQTGVNLTTPQFGTVEFDGTNLFLTNDSGSPTRKTLAFTDSTISGGQIANGTITGAMLANGAVGSAQLAAGAVTATAIAPGTVLPTQTVSGNTAAVANTSYAATGSVTPDTFTLPVTANVGDVIQITGNGSAGWNTTGAWVARESNRQWRAVASSDDGSKQVAVVFGGRIYTSTDHGTSWTPRESNRNWRAVASSADGNDLVATVEGGQIFTSWNSGVTWTARESNRNWRAVASSADGDQLVAVVYGGEIYTSDNNGVSWTPLGSSQFWYSVASSADGSRLIVSTIGGALYTSTDSGATWTPRDNVRSWRGVASSADGTKLVAVVNSGSIYTSTDSGVSWTPRAGPGFWESVTSSDDGTKLVAVELFGRIHTSTDSGATWTARGPHGQWFSVASSADGSELIAAMQGGQLYTSLSGVQGNAVSLQYAGNGQWTTMQETQIAPGAVGNTQIGSGLDVPKLGSGTVDNTEFAYLDGVTSGIQGQLNGKVSKSGDTMTGALVLPTNGLSVGGTQLVADNTGVGIGTANAGNSLYRLAVKGKNFNGTDWIMSISDSSDVARWGLLLSDSGNLGFASNGVRLYLDQNGNIGIGTSSPGAKLHLKAQAANNRDNGIRLEHANNTSRWNIHTEETYNNLTFSFNDNYGSGGNYCYLNNSQAGLITVSDRTTKKDIAPLTGALDHVARLRPVSFRYKIAPDGSPVNYGFIAQEVEEVYPDLVLENAGLKTLAGKFPHRHQHPRRAGTE